jgi:hypothetical protein
MDRVSLKRVQAGQYTSEDGRFEVRNTKDGSGAPHVRHGIGHPHWLVRDTETGRLYRCFTLADVRGHYWVRVG